MHNCRLIDLRNSDSKDTEILTLKELKVELKTRKLPTEGTREELIARLDEAILEQMEIEEKSKRKRKKK